MTRPNVIAIAITTFTLVCAAQDVENPLGLFAAHSGEISELSHHRDPSLRVCFPCLAPVEDNLPPPGNQGKTQGSCTAWSVAFAVRTALPAEANASWRPRDSKSRQFSPSLPLQCA